MSSGPRFRQRHYEFNRDDIVGAYRQYFNDWDPSTWGGFGTLFNSVVYRVPSYRPTFIAERTWDVNHSLEHPKIAKWFPPRNMGGRPRFRWVHDRSHGYNVGGPFLNIAQNWPWGVVHSPNSSSASQPWIIHNRYDGGFIPTDFGPYVTELTGDFAGPSQIPGTHAYSWYPGSDVIDAWQYGAEAWNKFKPVKPTADFGLAAAEAGDIIPQFTKSLEGLKDLWHQLGGHPVKFGPRKVADHFLNHKFGWVPFINDLNKMFNTFRDQDSTLKQWKRDNDQWVYRRGSLFNRVENRTHFWQKEGMGSPCVYPILPDDMYSTPGANATASQGYAERYDHCWFAARFKYYNRFLELEDSRDEATASVAHVMNLIHLYGARVNPTLLWRHTPFTFLADWFVNIGPVFDNWDSAEDNLVAKYAYVMREVGLRLINETSVHLHSGPVNCRWAVKHRSKHRAEANPFGFGPSSQVLSGSQYAIMAALGITHVPH